MANTLSNWQHGSIEFYAKHEESKLEKSSKISKKIVIASN
jgi:hypothetical protein